MQSIEAKRDYKNSFACAAKIFRDEGLLTFWSGAVPRLARLILSGGIVFTMYTHLKISQQKNLDCLTDCHRYEKTMEGLDRLDPEKKYV